MPYKKPILCIVFLGLLVSTVAIVAFKVGSSRRWVNDDLSKSGEKCLNSWESILRLDFNHYGKLEDANEPRIRLTSPVTLLKHLSELANDLCTPAQGPTAPIVKSMIAFQKACQDIDSRVANTEGLSGYYSGAPGDRCLQETLRYRFAAAGTLYSQVPIYEIRDPSLLVNLIYAEAFHPNRSTIRLGDLLIRLLSLDMKNLHAAKFLVKVTYTYWINSRTIKGKDKAQKLFETALTHTESLGRPDYQLREMRLRQAVRLKDITRIRSQADVAAQYGYPELARFYLAWGDYLTGNVKSAAERVYEVLVGRTGDHYHRGALALNRLNGQIPNPFTEDGLGLGLFFLVSDPKSQTTIGTGSVHTDLVVEEARWDNPDPEIKKAYRDLRAFEQGKRACAQADGWDRSQPLPDWESATANYRVCVERSMASWGQVEVNPNGY